MKSGNPTMAGGSLSIEQIKTNVSWIWKFAAVRGFKKELTSNEKKKKKKKKRFLEDGRAIERWVKLL